MKNVTPNPTHHLFRADMIELLKKHAGHLRADEFLAIAAHMLGQILAMQDQRVTPMKVAMEIIGANIEAGNAEVIASLCASAGKA